MVACLDAYRNDSVNREKQMLQEEWGEFWSHALELEKGMGSSAQVEGLALGRSVDSSTRDMPGKTHDVEVTAGWGFPDGSFLSEIGSKVQVTS